MITVSTVQTQAADIVGGARQDHMTPEYFRHHRRAPPRWSFGLASPATAGDAAAARDAASTGAPKTLTESDDHELLFAVGGGSAPALEELLHRHGVAVYALADLLAHDIRTVDAVVVDVFVALSRRLGHMEDGVANVRLGLMAMARRRSPRSDGPADDAAVGGGFAKVSEATPLSRLRSLPRKHREPVALTVMAKGTLTEVALVLGVDRYLVASRLRAGLRLARPGAAPPPPVIAPAA